MTHAKHLTMALAGSVATLALTFPAQAQTGHGYGYGIEPSVLYLFDGKRFYGEHVFLDGAVDKLDFLNFNDRADSLDFTGLGWLVCKHARLEGPCLVVREPVSDLDDFGLGDEISSVRPLSDRNPYPHGTIFGQNWAGDIVFYETDFFGNLSEMDPYDAWGYSYGDGYRSGAYGDYGRYGYYDPYNPYQDYDPTKWTGYRGPRNADIVLYRDPGFRGSAYGLNRDAWNLSNLYFNDEVSSVEIRRGKWEVCTDSEFRGNCQIFDASVSRLNDLRLNDNISSVRRIDGYRGGRDKNRGDHGHYSGGRGGSHGGHDQDRDRDSGDHKDRDGAVTLYEHSNFNGRYVSVNGDIANLSTLNLNDAASSIKIRSGTWEICEHPNFQGRCEIVNASNPSLGGLRLNDNVSSIRRAEGRQPSPPVPPRWSDPDPVRPGKYNGPASPSDVVTAKQPPQRVFQQEAEPVQNRNNPDIPDMPAPRVRENRESSPQPRIITKTPPHPNWPTIAENSSGKTAVPLPERSAPAPRPKDVWQNIPKVNAPVRAEPAPVLPPPAYRQAPEPKQSTPPPPPAPKPVFQPPPQPTQTAPSPKPVAKTPPTRQNRPSEIEQDPRNNRQPYQEVR